MPKLYTGGDFESLRNALAQGRPVRGAVVTPGAGVNVNVSAGVIKTPDVNGVPGTLVKVAGATNLATAAPGDAGQSIRYAIRAAIADGTITALAGAAATTGSQAAPAALNANTHVLLAYVDVANGDAAVTQSMIDMTAANAL